MTVNTIFKKQLGQEYIDAEEDKIIANMLEQMQAQMKRMYKDTKVPRQIHTKMHGCVKAAFIIEPHLPTELKVGIFKEEKTYNAWVRFSNSNSKPGPDKKKDIRGIAIKLMGVPGEKLLNDQHLEATQDFLLMSSETFFSRNLTQFKRTLASSTSFFVTRIILYFLNPLHWNVLKRLLRSFIQCNNPLEIPYWSTQPYQYGDDDKAVKYFLRPSPYNTIINKNTTEDDYLRTNMVQTLVSNEIEYDFCIQFQTNPDTMPIEDPTIAWTSPFYKVATLKIIRQIFNTREKLLFGENLSFNSWHCLPAHRPLGSFNRARKRIYQEMSKYRHKENNMHVFEPKDSPDFLDQHKELILEPNTPTIPLNKVVKRSVEILVNCNQEKAYNFIIGTDDLPLWLKKYSIIDGAKYSNIIEGPYNYNGAKRKLFFEKGDSIIEELLICNFPFNYSYSVSQFTSIFKHLTNAAYGQFWFDTNDNQTRITWEYSITYKNIFSRCIISLLMPLVFKKFLKQSLENAKGIIENMD